MINQRRFRSLSKAGMRAGKFAFLGVQLLAAAALCAFAEAGPDDAKGVAKDDIRNVRWTTRRLVYRSDDTKRYVTDKFWAKLPDKFRSEGPGTVTVINGRQRWQYAKGAKVYNTRRDESPYAIPTERFYPEWIAKVYQVGADNSSTRKTEAVFKGKVYPAQETEIFDPDSGNEELSLARRHIMIYIDSGTGLIRATTIKGWNAEGVKVEDTTTEYEYEEEDPPDDFFIFQPPPGAKEEPWKRKDK